MKLSSTKPVSSPGRPDKFPPPLMRFLRTNAGSKSRGSSSRSRSNPIFLRKKNHNTIETQEPSSPKVTCMGQVRVRRAAAASAAVPTKYHRDIWCVPNALFCHHKIKPTSSSSSSCCHWKFKPVWPNWGFLFRRKASKVTESSTKTEHEESEDDENRVNANAFVSNCSSSYLQPPRDALLLTRCRSAPYRSSSLASKFWGSPLRNEEETGEEQGNLLENREREPNLKRESVLEQDPKLERKLRFFKELEESLRERIMESEKVRELKRKQEEKEAEGEYATPVVLTRCKSEPARTAEKVDPD